MPAIKETAAFVTRRPNGDGVAELVDELVLNDLSRLEGRMHRHLIQVESRADSSNVLISPYGRN